jgi:antitoxin PrlF
MSTATVTAKGQVTIPADVRRRMRLDAGDSIEFVEVEDGEYLIKPANDDVRTLKGLLRTPSKSISVADMNAMIRRRASGR